MIVKNRIMCCQLLVLCSIAMLTACSSSEQEANLSIHAEMYKLAHANGCIDCHRVKATVIGPSWDAISKRYQDVPRAEARALLIERVKKGSSGNWNTWKGGSGMPPLEKRVAAEHIERLVDYILSLHPQVH